MAESRQEWVSRVLGIAAEARGPMPDARPRPLLPIWQTAKETIDRQLTALAGSFRDTAHPLGAAIAEQGLPRLTNRVFVGLMASLFDYDGADAARRAAAAAQVRQRVEAFRATLGGEGLWSLLDDNPYGTTVSLRADIGKTLDAIEAALH